jgi:hypothetical protein
MDQLGAEKLQPVLKFRYEVVEFSFNIGRLGDFVADMDVHSLPRKRGADPVKLLSSFKAILHLSNVKKWREL